MAYRANVSDDQQTKVEAAAAKSAIRLPWWKQNQTAATIALRANDLQAQAEAGGAPTSAVEQIPHAIIGTHGDAPGRELVIGRA